MISYLKKKKYLALDSSRDWPVNSAKIIYKQIKSNYKKTGGCRIMTASGKGASKMHNQLSKMIVYGNLKNIKIFLADERVLSQFNSESNYKNIKKIYKKCKNVYVYRLFQDEKNIHNSVKKYQNLIKRGVHILILGFAIDGHLASLFPPKNLLQENNFLFTKKENESFKRWTIGYKFIKNECGVVYVLLDHLNKRRLASKIFCDKNLNQPLYNLYQ